jgi:hypothetical protein
MAGIDPMRGMITSYLASPKGQEMIRDYLTSPEGQRTICEFVSTPQGRQVVRQILPGMLGCLSLPPEVTALVAEKIRTLQ